MSKYTLFFILFFPIFLSAQVFQDDFSDGDFTNNPTWLGSTSIFIVNANNELQLNDVAGGSAQLYTPVAIADSTIWEFSFRLEFAPSASNQLRVYLTADNNDFSASLNGYFLQLGEGNAQDAIEIYRQSGSTKTLLFRGTDATVAIDPAQARVRIIRDNAGNWTLFTDYTGGNNLTLEGTFTDNTFSTGNYFGIDCDYTTSRKDKFFLDSFIIQPLFVDTAPPILDSVWVVNANQINVKFNEALDINSLQSTDFNLSNIGNPSNFSLDISDPSLVHLTFNNSLSDGQNYTLTVSNVADVNGNTLTTTSKNFTFINLQMAQVGDVLINEILADPSPSVGLPEVEFVELFNNSNKAIQLGSLIFHNSSVAFPLPNFTFLAGNYVILCDADDIGMLTNFGNVIGLNNFSALANNGDDLKIENTNGDEIHAVSYTSSWYGDQNKSNGGYSLELKNPTLLCIDADNWQASNASNGGTPGQQNSVFDNTPDTQAPRVTAIVPISDQVIDVFFDEIFDENTALNPANYEINLIGTASNVSIIAPQQVQLTFSTTFQNATTYQLTLENIEDCSGNAMNASDETFVFYQTGIAERYDILITEIFSKPSPSMGLPELEFIELYNRSNKAIDLQDFIFATKNTEIVLPYFVLLPNQYVILYETGQASNYNSYGFTLPLQILPALGNLSDNLQLISTEDELIHFVNYQSSWYQDNNKDDGGFSLEMKNINQYCDDISNWSATLALIGGTPGQENSIAETMQISSSPIPLHVFPITTNQIEIFFNKALNPIIAEDINQYQISNALSVLNVEINSLDYKSVILTLNGTFQNDQSYTISIQSTLTDCQGTPLVTPMTLEFATPKSIEEGDILINEILFNPASGGVDFIELYNSSDKVLNLGDLTIGNTENGVLAAFELIKNDYLFFPKTYLTISENINEIQNRYINNLIDVPSNLFVANDLPSFPDNQGGVILVSNGLIIDQLEYSADWHHPLLTNKEGVSLERINFNTTTQDPNNWHSAASTVGYATPSQINSQFLENAASVDDKISFTKNTFSPDDDGFDDFLLINYELDVPDLVANVSIYDANGRLVRLLIRNELLGTSGTLKWDGSTDDQTKARMGIYIVVVELVHPNGQVEQIKKTSVLAGKL